MAVQLEESVEEGRVLCFKSLVYSGPGKSQLGVMEEAGEKPWVPGARALLGFEARSGCDHPVAACQCQALSRCFDTHPSPSPRPLIPETGAPRFYKRGNNCG